MNDQEAELFLVDLRNRPVANPRKESNNPMTTTTETTEESRW